MRILVAASLAVLAPAALLASWDRTAAPAAIAASPQMTQGAAACASISNNDERLACYDHLFADQQQRQDALGQWRVSTNAGPRNDLGRVIIGLPAMATDYAGSKRGPQTPPLHLFAACRHGGTTFWFNFGQELKNRSDNVAASLSVDGSPVGLASLTLSNNRRSVGMFDTDRARDLLQDWQDKAVLELRLTPDGERASTSRFDIRKLDIALRPLARACRWPAT